MPHDAQHVAMMNIKHLRRELRAWGRYWAHQERGQGYSSRSACDRLKDPFTPNSCAVTSDHVPPRHVVRYDVTVTGLAIDCRRAIRAQYICQGQWQLLGFDSKKTFLFWLRRAEIALIGG